MASTIKEFAHLQIPLDDILNATNNFADENIIGKGGFGNVYKGILMRYEEPTNIAARRLDRRHGQGDVEFWTEISVLSSIDHENLITMIGYCDEKGEKIIIHHYYAKGSLLMHLNDPCLRWSQRLSISEGVANAIANIHNVKGQNYYIIHRNINSSTILLDDYGYPMLSGFEFSIKHSVDRRNQVFLSETIGTLGYMDPAIEKNGGVTHKSDIYSLGVVLFELLCSRKAIEGNKLLAPLAKFHYENGTLQDIIHPDLWNQMDPESFRYFSQAAYSCLEDVRLQRPDASQVIDELTTAIRLQYMYETGNQQDTEEEETLEEEFESYIENPSSSPSKKDTEEEETLEEEFGSYIESLSSSPPEKVKGLEHLRIELGNIQLATDNFSERFVISERNAIQRNDYYKAELECFDKEYVSSVEGKNKDELPRRHYTVKLKCIDNRVDVLDREVEILSSCKHRNIESLLGFSDEGPDMTIIYEYVSDRYLYNHLKDRNLTWDKRLKICIDVAHGLNYLHNEMEDQKAVIHCDINSRNVELDDKWRAKIVGFGHSVFMPPDQDDGVLVYNAYNYDEDYIDPEFLITGAVKRESDVFSFGALMFEILCGIPIGYLVANEDSQNNGLSHLAKTWYEDGRIKKKISPVLKGENGDSKLFLNKGPNEHSLETFIKVACQCLEEKQNRRPTMKTVITELGKALYFQENNKDSFRIPLEEIKLATQNFCHDNNIGGGGFGRVYKGELTQYGHHTIVAKQLDTSHGQGETQFYNELQILHEYKHENIISLVGYSNETDERIIVYEHASKGSLDKYLNDASLTWRNRLKICIDFARGLDFLHGGVDGKEVVIHRDIKTANILLFDDWKAKIGDFGLSIISTVNEQTDYVIDHACGTPGYLDPLYLKSGFLTIESDIYSFGVVLFEIMCGRSTFETRKHDGRFLPSFIKHKFEEGKQDEVVFEALKKEIMPKSLTTFQNIAYQCLDDDREKRPRAKQVLAQLNKALEFQEDENIGAATS